MFCFSAWVGVCGFRSWDAGRECAACLLRLAALLGRTRCGMEGWDGHGWGGEELGIWISRICGRVRVCIWGLASWGLGYKAGGGSGAAAA